MPGYEELNQYELRKVADYLYDGHVKVAPLMMQIRSFKKGDRVLLWLVKEKIRGQAMIDYFKTEQNEENNHGVILGVQKALSYIEGHPLRREKLTLKDLK